MMQANNSAESSTTATQAVSPDGAAADTSSFYTYGWLLPFTIACAVIYWYLTKPRRSPSESTFVAQREPGSETPQAGESKHSTGFKPRKQVNKKLAKKKHRVKVVNEVEHASQIDGGTATVTQQSGGGLSKRQRKLLAAKSVDVDRNLVVDRNVVGAMSADNGKPVGDADQAGPAESVPAVQAIFAPIRAATPTAESKAAEPASDIEGEASDLPRRKPSDARSKGKPREGDTPVAKPIIKNTVFVPQKREVLVDRNADRWAAIQPVNAGLSTSHITDSVSKVDEAQDGISNASEASQSPQQPHVGLQGFVRKVRSKAVSQSE